MAYDNSFPFTVNPTLLIPLLCSLFVSFNNTPLLFAQGQVIPVANTQMPFVRVGSRLFVPGGPQNSNSGSYFALELSKSWSVDTAVWTAHDFGRFVNEKTYYGVGDNQMLYMFPIDGVEDYRIDLTDPNAKWSVMKTTEPLECAIYIPVIDPRTGLIYSASSNLYGESICVFDRSTQTWKLSQVSNGTLAERNYDGAVYNSARNSIMFGYRSKTQGVVIAAHITEYLIDRNSWSYYFVKGQTPTERRANCMAINDDASKIVVFGGHTLNADISSATYSSEIFVLDVNSKEWKKGPNANEPRGYAACTLVGDQFVVWGGERNRAEAPFGSVLVFDLTQFAWVTTYKAPSYLQSLEPTIISSTGSQGPSYTTLPGPTSEPSTMSIEVVIGSVAGASALIALIGGMLFYIRRRKRSEVCEIVDGKIEIEDCYSTSIPEFEGCDKIEYAFSGNRQPFTSQTAKVTHSSREQNYRKKGSQL
ncbi:hypothetical protein BX616_007313 [Lobosporangium transversale]|uniref:Kelch repeat protein n=1 Tax=Lobosporangium transversale TaxID=64571 RepID=A0A1Y2H7T6_9FUNG|nr:hypothetical protein BCR41DRAFT_382957 [Lobosporangium transversale]KAF9914912.1 hypothetical protein BX616_007313 [Lobosporangium transversale]ORZ29102.1 hypothetical protein BCR41DRAFT_382957 [Lobosporangium transversale]|eukprot:XP_021886775.1 hypothetical protein BCR41DRAFT_382957 [Lobosporangium transversale]